MSASSKPVPIAIPNDLHAQIAEAAEATGWSRQDIMRLAMRVGLEHLRRIHYDLAGAARVTTPSSSMTGRS